ncbi:MAG: DUF952 domain-containing protein [Hyphomicrobiales bacterium]|nr:DUF952 domain-containing protein [Hyphomicrobiales bacterium]
MTLIYKILSADLWRQAEASGEFRGAPVDLADGFIHFSFAGQLAETAQKHFFGQKDLLLLSVAEADLGPALKHEVSRGGALFPHLYGPLPVTKVRRVAALPARSDGSHDFRDLLP